MNRLIELEGVSNFRDLGGYETMDGRSVRWRTIFRSDTLASLTDNDVETVCGLGVTTTCDLRYAEERRNEPSRFLEHDDVEVLALGLAERPGASFLDSFELSTDPRAAARTYLLANYRQYPFLYAGAYRAIFERLLAGEQLVIHCTAGKDRAGTAAAMVLTALGVPRDVVFDDYMLTNVYWDRGGREPLGMDAETVAAIFSARAEYLAAAFEAIESRHGGVDAYLAEEIGLDETTRSRLRDICLT